MNGRSCVFLDRDGVIIRERGEHTWLLADVELLPGVPEALLALRRTGHLIILITNQSGIGLGLYGHADVEQVHAYLHERLDPLGAGFDDVYYCPHHPSKGRCLCRKPGSLMLERAIARHGIAPDRSVMIGDRDRDTDAATAVGVRGILIPANAPLLPVLSEHGLLP
ncbi:MAG: HAD family hydrolase [Flavobacteriales bacterium]|nr:HAD family hydrolase [Flavobacteriales bacterium]